MAVVTVQSLTTLRGPCRPRQSEEWLSHTGSSTERRVSPVACPVETQGSWWGVEVKVARALESPVPDQADGPEKTL